MRVTLLRYTVHFKIKKEKKCRQVDKATSSKVRILEVKIERGWGRYYIAYMKEMSEIEVGSEEENKK